MIEQEIIQCEKSYLDQLIFNYFKDMNELRIRGNFPALVKTMAQSQNQIDFLKGRMQSEFKT